MHDTEKETQKRYGISAQQYFNEQDERTAMGCFTIVLFVVAAIIVALLTYSNLK